jgi:outer membrane lipoprotein-sorting protein
MESQGPKLRETKCRVWLKKPNHFRVETTRGSWGKKFGVLIGDGDNLWLYWPNGRPRFHMEDDDTYEKTSRDVYMTEPTPLGRHSIAFPGGHRFSRGCTESCSTTTASTGGGDVSFAAWASFG